MDYKVSGEIYRRLMRRFWRMMVTYTVALLFLIWLGYFVCSHQVWYASDPLYPLLHLINDNLISTFLAGLLMGGMLISCGYLYYITRLMERIVGAVGAVYQEDEGAIRLPGILKEIEVQLKEIMTNIKNSRYEAERTQQQKSDMIMYMAHDLKTPLTSVIGYLSILQEEYQIPEELKSKYLSIAMEKAYRLEDLINEFFEMTRFNFSHMPLELSRVNLSRMIEQIVYEFKPVFMNKGLECKLDIQQDLFLMCDVDQMERVFDNLLRNIANYSYDNTTVDITAVACPEKNVRILFQNHGKTIPPEKLEHIFEQFYRLDSSRDSKTGGTGLGLAIAKEIILLHQGEITCESQEEQVRFQIIL